MEQQLKVVCPKCQGNMRPGATGVSLTFVAYWFEGLFDGNGRFSLSSKNRRKVYDYRCASCGYLERYAH